MRDPIFQELETQTLDDLLARWHFWMLGTRATKGYSACGPTFQQYRVSRQWDDFNGSLDTDLENIRSEAVDFEVSEMADPWRAAIFMEARNLCTGHSVWISPRLPTDDDRRREVVAQARRQLTDRLISAGVIA